MCSNPSSTCVRASNAGSKEASHTWSQCAFTGTMTETCLTFSPWRRILRDQWRHGASAREKWAAAHLPQVHVNFVGSRAHRQSSQGRLALSGVGGGRGGRKPGTRCSLGSRRNTVRTSRTLYCFLRRGGEAGARDRRTATYLLALHNISPRKSERIIEMKSRKGIKEDINEDLASGTQWKTQRVC